MGMLDNLLNSLSTLNKENLREGKFSPSGGAPDPVPIDESVISRISGFKPNEGLVVDPIPARQV